MRGGRGGLLLSGCRPEIAAGPDGRIIATGEAARAAAGSGAAVVEVSGQALPGLHDAHLHLEHIARLRLGLDLSGAGSLEAALARIRARSLRLPADAWLTGWGWRNDAWPEPALPSRGHLDRAAGGRPVFLPRADGHSAWLSTAALRAAGITRDSAVPAGGVVDRDEGGEPTGIVRETAVDLARRVVPRDSQADFDRALEAGLGGLAALGLTAVQTFDTAYGLGALERLHAAGRLPIRVTYHLPAADFPAAERLGLRSGLGDGHLRLWGVKGFLDGSLGSRTAQMLDGGGVPVMPQAELEDLARRCAGAGLNLCVHAIGDGAVRRALDAFEPLAGSSATWRPRIEHAQVVDARDRPRFRRTGVIASMQPIHAVTDRRVADAEWGTRTAGAYAWAALARAGATLAFGSDAPVESADPLAGIDAATAWRGRAGWHPDLALGRAAAVAAYTSGAAYSVGMERDLGRLTAGRLCDVTVVDRRGVVATVVGGRLVHRRATG